MSLLWINSYLWYILFIYYAYTKYGVVWVVNRESRIVPLYLMTNNIAMFKDLT